MYSEFLIFGIEIFFLKHVFWLLLAYDLYEERVSYREKEKIRQNCLIDTDQNKIKTEINLK